MHLLRHKSQGDYELVTYNTDDVPPYATLSHTWIEGEEVTYGELLAGTGKDKAGYTKICFCGERAAQDGLDLFWVDTCCIDKTNSVELQEALNSMFRWYQKAAKCYVYLSDVSTAKRKACDRSSELPWETSFRASRWFTRGWTLQELLAPSSVEFFSRERQWLGNKRTLEGQIFETTHIPIQALRGTALSQFGIDERMSWAQHRRTTRNEDKAYSLLGIFDVYMPLIYGEGEAGAFARLREAIDKPLQVLNRLPYASDALFNSYSKQDSPSCLPGTRVDLLREIYTWADGNDERCIFWLSGLAGTGKSTIARTVARQYLDQQRLGASFFFSRGGGDISHAGKFCTTVAVQLASSVPSLRRHICDAVADHSDVARLSLDDQWRQLILRPLSKLSNIPYQSSFVIAVDALDECSDDRDIRALLRLLTEVRSLTTIRLRVFLTSRPEIPIRYGFRQISQAYHQDFVLHNISPSIVDQDILIFLQHSLKRIREECSLNAGWPGEGSVTRLVQIANGLFIWAATACRFIREGKRFAAKRLTAILQGVNSAPTTPEKHLDEIYTTVLRQSVPEQFTEEEREEASYMLRRIVGCIVTLFSPLSARSLGKLLCIAKGDLDQTLDDLYSILDVPEDRTQPLRLHHPSFRDFLLNRTRCGDLDFWVEEKQAHQTLAESCIRLMSTSLKQDICELDAPGVLISELDSSRVEQYLPPEVQYACLYWAEHLRKSGDKLQNNDQVHQFLETHFLHWLEALSWTRRVSEAILAIRTLESIALTSDCPQLYAFAHDMTRFALSCRVAIEQAPLQTYSSALIFAPEKSIVRKQFKDKIPKWMRRLPQVRDDWSASLQTLEGHTDCVTAVAFSPDGALLASASDDMTVRLWDAVTGAALKTFEGHTRLVTLVAFSQDGALLVSNSCDATVRLWDAVTGAALKTLEGHTARGRVTSMAFSPDGALLASASNDTTVRLWNVVTGAALKTLEGYKAALLASADGNNTVQPWVTATDAALKRITLKYRSSLETNHGLLPLENLEDCYPLNISPELPPQPRIVLEGNWVLRKSERLIWLPAEYRGNCSACRGIILAIGHHDGLVTFMEIG